MPGPALAFSPDHYSAADAAEYVELTLIGNYVLYATATILVYELFTSLDDEVERVWSLRWHVPKVLFMLNRYVIRAMLLVLWILANYPGTSPEFCRIYSYWQMVPLRLAILAAQALVVIRVWAIYNNSRRMFWVLSILYTLEVAAVAICVIGATLDTQGVAQPAPLSCGLNSMSGYLLKEYASGTWIAPVCFEFVLLVITLAKLVPRWSWNSGGHEDVNGRRLNTTVLGRLGSGGNVTLDILARDSLVYFGFIFSFTLTNAIIYGLSFSAHYHAILLGPTSAISCIAVSRMMINIRSLPTSPHAQRPTTGGGYAGELSFAATYADLDSATRTEYFDFSPQAGGSFANTGRGYAGVPSTATPGSAYFDVSPPSHTYSRQQRPRPGGNPMQVNLGGRDAEMGIEMEFRKGSLG